MPHSIAIDGPVGAGKSTVAREVAAALGVLHLDTGAMYRALGLKMLRLGEDPGEESAAVRICRETAVNVVFERGAQRTMLDGEDVTELLRSPEVSAAASAVSRWAQVRARMVASQREIASGIDIVLDGRDIGTRVLPRATLKIFLTADPSARAERRYAELAAKGADVTPAEVLADLLARDGQDTGRAVDPLRQAEDAVPLDTTRMTQAEVVARVLALFREAAGKAPARRR